MHTNADDAVLLMLSALESETPRGSSIAILHHLKMVIDLLSKNIGQNNLHDSFENRLVDAGLKTFQVKPNSLVLASN